jgi:hypothetical protein
MPFAGADFKGMTFAASRAHGLIGEASDSIRAHGLAGEAYRSNAENVSAMR